MMLVLGRQWCLGAFRSGRSTAFSSVGADTDDNTGELQVTVVGEMEIDRFET